MLLTTITFFFILSVLVLVHEFGHFLLAKKTGIKVEEFGFGYPPRIFAKKIGETIYSINLLPFGGFVRLFGEESFDFAQDKQESKRTFWAKSKKARFAVIVAGVMANFFLGIISFAIVYFVLGIPTKTDRIRIVEIAPNSPAFEAGLKNDDIIIMVENQTIKDTEQFTKVIQENKGRQVRITVNREKDNPCVEKVLGGGPPPTEGYGEARPSFSCQDGRLLLFITPRVQPPEGEGPLGVVISNIETVKYPPWQMPFRGIFEGTKEALNWAVFILGALGKMLTDLLGRGIVPRDVAGPVGIFQISGMVAKAGILNVFQFIGILSVNLAVINILPFPALDGGRLLFVVYEAISRRRPRPSLERWANATGMAFIMILIVLITINDISRLTLTQRILGQLRQLWPF